MVHHTPITDSGDLLHLTNPCRTLKIGRSDTHFPLSTLSTPRRHRAPSITGTMLEGQESAKPTTQKLSVRVVAPADGQDEDVSKTAEKSAGGVAPGRAEKLSGRPGKTLEDLPIEIQALILDYLFGDIHSVTSSTTSLLSSTTRLSSVMRHPRRKALTDVALVSPAWRELVQERIYRHIKIKGNRAGLAESTEWFSENFQLTRHVRHIEFWVPVWADKSPEHQKTRFMDTPTATGIHDRTNILHHHMSDTDDQPYPSFTYPFSDGRTSATLSEIFSHISCFFSQAQIFTLEGGHCKNSHMIRQFPSTLFPTSDRKLDVLPHIRNFAMRGAWNIMRDHAHWTVIESALPGLQEWHCSYASPRLEAYTTINSILTHFPPKIRHLDISLDGFYCKDGGETLGSSPQSSYLPTQHHHHHHLCETLGRIAPQLESLSFTGRICEAFFRTATEAACGRKEGSRLHAVDVIVKSCCRMMVVGQPVAAAAAAAAADDADDDVAGEHAHSEAESEAADVDATTNTSMETLASSPASTAIPTTIPGSLTSTHFLTAFERLILSAIRSLDYAAFPVLNQVRIRFIDLDSGCMLLNPWFVFRAGHDRGSSGLDGGRCEGVWNEEILAALAMVRGGSVGWVGLGDCETDAGQGRDGVEEGGRDGAAKIVDGEMGSAPLLLGELVKSGGSGNDSGNGSASASASGAGAGVAVRRKPRAIKGSAYRILANAR